MNRRTKLAWFDKLYSHINDNCDPDGDYCFELEGDNGSALVSFKAESNIIAIFLNIVTKLINIDDAEQYLVSFESTGIGCVIGPDKEVSGSFDINTNYDWNYELLKPKENIHYSVELGKSILQIILGYNDNKVTISFHGDSLINIIYAGTHPDIDIALGNSNDTEFIVE